MALGAPLMSTRGWGAPEVEQAFNRARELCEQLGDTPQLFGVLMGLWVFHATGGSTFETARELAEQLLRLAKEQDDPALLLQAHIALVPTPQFQGDLPAAREHFEQALALYDTQRHGSLVSVFGLDLGVFALSHGASILWLLGYPDQARKQAREGLTLAQELVHPHSVAWASVLAATVQSWRGEVQAAEAEAEAAMTRSRDLGFTIPLAWATIQHGWTLVEQGRHERGIGQARGALNILRQAGTEVWVTYYLALLVEMHGEAGQAEEGLAVLLEALDLCDRRGDRWYEAELYRLKGELILQSGRERPESAVQQEAEACFLKALEVAREQSAKSWELRAATSLGRLWQQQGRRAEARELLSGIYDWFTEGFDTKDLRGAKALLDTLA
jgi:predicted ATPase